MSENARERQRVSGSVMGFQEFHVGARECQGILGSARGAIECQGAPESARGAIEFQGVPGNARGYSSLLS